MSDEIAKQVFEDKLWHYLNNKLKDSYQARLIFDRVMALMREVRAFGA